MTTEWPETDTMMAVYLEELARTLSVRMAPLVREAARRLREHDTQEVNATR